MNSDQNREVVLNGCRVAYLLKTSLRARNLRITIRPGGEVVAVRPRRFPESFVDDFLVKKSVWVLKMIRRLKDKQGLMAGGTKADFKNHAPAARRLALEKIEKFSGIYNVVFNRLAIRDQRTRWGSCSRKGNLNFNYRIALLPDRLSDYIVAHEICHLRELNHSRRFWDLVAVAIPDYAARRKELKNNYC